MAITHTDGAKTLYSYAAEATPGVAPSASYQTLRCNSGVQLNLKRNTFMSQDLRSDRMESSLSFGTKSGELSIPVEWSYGTYDDILEAIMGGSWTGNVLKVGNNVRTFTFEEKAPELSIIERALGCQFKSFSISQKNDAIAEGTITGIFRGTKVAQTIGVNLAYDATEKTITRESAGFITIDGWVVGDEVCGSGNEDSGNNNVIPWIITGLTDTVMTFSTATGIVTKIASSGITLNLGTRATSLLADTSNSPFSSLSGGISVAGVTIAHITGWELKVEQDMDANFCIGSTEAQSVSVGTLKVSGSLTAFYVNQELRKRYSNGLVGSISLSLGQVSSMYTFDMGVVSFTEHTRDHGQLARMESINFKATYDNTSSSSLVITRIS